MTNEAKGSGLLSFLAPLDATMRQTFITKYTDEIAAAYSSTHRW